jgi:hypothetical protein
MNAGPISQHSATIRHQDTVCISHEDLFITPKVQEFARREAIQQHREMIKVQLGFKSGSEPSTLTHGRDGDEYVVTEDALRMGLVPSKLDNHYKGREIQLVISIHKESLLEPVLHLVESIERDNPTLYQNLKLFIRPSLSRCAALSHWLQNGPSMNERWPRIIWNEPIRPLPRSA